MITNHRPLKFVLFGLAMIAAFVALLLSTTHVSAFPLGVTGRSGNPATNGGATCSMCHSGGEKPTVTIIGPASVQPGETNQYTLRISGGPASTAGFNVSATGGAIASLSSDTQIRDGEATHTSPKDFSNGVATFVFNWTAPSSPGAVSMFGAGNSANGDFDTTGDGIGAASIIINVASPSGGGGAPAPNPSDCVVPASGPWPPCATGGGGAAPGDCVIPESGPWPPCATGGSTAPAPVGCVIPASGPWPPCATGGSTEPGSCVIPASGPWPPCAREIHASLR